jgi:hypothetical protein
MLSCGVLFLNHARETCPPLCLDHAMLTPRSSIDRQEEEDEHRQRLAIFQSKFGLYHPVILDTLSRLVDILLDQGRYGAAEKLVKQEAGARQKVAGDDDRATLLAFSMLSHTFRLQGKGQAAENLSKKVHEKASRALKISDRVLWGYQEYICWLFEQQTQI